MAAKLEIRSALKCIFQEVLSETSLSTLSNLHVALLMSDFVSDRVIKSFSHLANVYIKHL